MNKSPLRPALVFFVCGGLWILVSDYLLSTFLEEGSFLLGQNVKGLFFIFMASVVFYIVVQKEQKNLKKSETNYKRLFYENPVPLWIYDPLSGEIKTANIAASECYGYSLKEIVKLNCEKLRADFSELKEKFNTDSLSVLHDTGVSLHKKKGGHVFYVKERKHETVYDNRKLTLVMAISLDKVVKLEQKIVKQNDLLRDVSQFQSHNIRRPVANILGLTQLIKAQSYEVSMQEDVFDKLHKEATDLDNMIRSIVQRSDELILQEY